MPIHRQDFQLLQPLVKMNKSYQGTKWSVPQLLWRFFHVRGTIQGFQLGWRQLTWILPTIRRTLFLVVHDHLDQERQSEGSRHMRCIVVLRQDSVPAVSLLCLPTLRQKLVGKIVLFISRQHHHVLPELMCLRQVTCLCCSPFCRCRIWVLYLNWIQKELRLHVQLLACTLL